MDVHEAAVSVVESPETTAALLAHVEAILTEREARNDYRMGRIGNDLWEAAFQARLRAERRWSNALDAKVKEATGHVLSGVR